MKKRLLSVLLCAALLFALLPALAGTASAAVSISVSGSSVYSRGAGWEWNGSTKTLTLHGVEVTSVTVPAGTTVHHTGYNKITGDLWADGDMTIEGSGVLEVKRIYGGDFDYDVTVDGGYIVCDLVEAGSFTMKSGYFECETSHAMTEPINLYGGRYTQTGGYVKLTQTGGRSALYVDGMGVRVSGGYLEAVSNCAQGTTLGAIYCNGNEVVNSGGVIKAVNTGGGYAINNRADDFSAFGGVTVAYTTEGTKAIKGRVYANSNGEKCYDAVDPGKKPTGAVIGGGELDGKEYVFCKHYNERMDPDNTSVYDVYVDGYYNKHASIMTVAYGRCFHFTGGCYFFSDSIGLQLYNNCKVEGSGTIVAEGGDTGFLICGTNGTSGSEVNTTISLTGTLVALGGKYGINQTAGKDVIYEGTELIARCKTKEAINYTGSSFDSVLKLNNAKLIAIKDELGESDYGAMYGAKLDADDSRVTVLSRKGSAMCFRRGTYEPKARFSVAGCDISLVSLYGKCPVDMYDIDTIEVWGGRLGCYGTEHGLPETKLFIDARLYDAPRLSGEFNVWGSDGTTVWKPAVYICSKQIDPCEYYTDLNRSAWYHGAVDYCIFCGLMGSTSTDTLTFEPNTKVSRAMVVSILYRMADSPNASYRGTFSDVPGGKWYTEAIEWAADEGIASGKGDGKFDPMGNVTRQELAVFMEKMADYLGYSVSGRADLSTFADAKSVPAWAKEYLQWAVSAGLISGKSNDGKTCLAPADNATRAELASIIMRFCEKFPAVT